MYVHVDKPWLAQYPPEIPVQLTYEEKPLFSYLKETAAAFPEKNALTFLGKKLTFAELYEKSLQLANFFKEIGLQKGDRVAIMLPNSPQAVISYYGVLMAGGIVVQTNPLYKERELKHQLKDSSSKYMICLDLLYERVRNVMDESNLKNIVVTSIKDFLPFPKNILYPLTQKKPKPSKRFLENDDTFLFKTALEKGSIEEINVPISPSDDLALIQYTGGTTGVAKGVKLTHLNLTSNTKMCIQWMYRCKKGEEKILGVLPFFHVFGMTVVMNLSVMFASEMIILPQFDAKEVLKTIEKHQPTIFPGAPTIFIALLNHPEITKFDLSSIQSCLSGSAPLPIEVQENFEKVTGGKLVEGYGLTESSPVTHANFLWEKRKKGSIGVPWPDTEAYIYSHEKDGPADLNEIGEIVVKGPQVMQGYWNLPEETEKVLKSGWLFTGDLGYMDQDGFFYIVDRKKDMIIAGGYNIFPREIEEVLYEHNSVKEAAVIGIKDTYRGETVKAFIVLKDGVSTTETELDDYCRKQLAVYKVPKLYEFRKELPKSPIGKVLKKVLMEEEDNQN